MEGGGRDAGAVVALTVRLTEATDEVAEVLLMGLVASS
jgi:hypothetical protein